MQLLNSQQRISRYSSKNLDIHTILSQHIANIYQTYYQVETQQFDYLGFAESEEFQTFQLMLSGLHQLDLTTLKTDHEKISFWLNIYNILCIHLVVKLGITHSIEEHSGFFSQYGYLIGGRKFSLDDIEHGILRANSKGYSKLQKTFKSNDLRLALVCKNIDPKVHFGLYCASISSPKLMLFETEKVTEQLQTNTAHCIEKHMRFNVDRAVIHVSKIFKWYESDFGNRDEIIKFITEHTNDKYTQSNLMIYKENIKLEFLTFEWALNKA